MPNVDNDELRCRVALTAASPTLTARGTRVRTGFPVLRTHEIFQPATVYTVSVRVASVGHNLMVPEGTAIHQR